MVDGDANFAGEVEVGIGGEGDDVGGSGVIEEVMVNLGDGGVIEEGYGEIAIGDGIVGEGVEGLEELL